MRDADDAEFRAERPMRQDANQLILAHLQLTVCLWMSVSGPGLSEGISEGVAVLPAARSTSIG